MTKTEQQINFETLAAAPPRPQRKKFEPSVSPVTGDDSEWRSLLDSEPEPTIEAVCDESVDDDRSSAAAENPRGRGAAADQLERSMFQGWQEIPLDDYVVIAGEIFTRSDGVKLLYKAAIIAIVAGGGSFKSYLAILIAIEVLRQKKRVLYIDYERDRALQYKRMRDAKAPEWHTDTDYLRVVRPVMPSLRQGRILDIAGLNSMLEWEPDLVVVDSVNFGMIMEGLNPNEMVDVQQFMQAVALPFKLQGSLVLLIDHLSKAALESGGKAMAFGSVQKDNALDARLNLKNILPIAPGKKGELVLVKTKDNHGHLEAICNDDDEVARVVVDSTGDFLEWQVLPPNGSSSTETRRVDSGKSGQAESFVLAQIKLEGDWEHTVTSLQGLRPHNLSERLIARAVRDLVQRGRLVKENRKRRSSGRTCDVLALPSTSSAAAPQPLGKSAAADQTAAQSPDADELLNSQQTSLLDGF